MTPIRPFLVLAVSTAAMLLDASSEEVPWYERALVGMEVGPTGAQWGADRRDVAYASKFDGGEIVGKQVEIGSDYLVIWAKDSEYAYYNSKVAPKCPGLGERDPLREAVDAAKPLGLPVVAYCVVQGNGYPLRYHTEYKMVGSDGNPIDRICLNSGYIEHAKACVAEMLEYGIDGFHIDMLDQGFGPPYGCWCDSCKAKFESKYGSPMPGGVTWDESWDRMLEFRYSTSETFEQEIREHIRAINPKASVDFNYHGYPPFSWEVGQRPVQHAHIGDFVTCESGVWGFSALGAGLTAVFTRATDPARRYQVVMQRGVRMYHDQTVRPVNDLRWEMFSLLANGAQVTIVEKTPFDGSIDRVTYERIGRVFGEVQAKREHFGQRPLEEVGLYYSSRTRDWIGRENPARYQQSFFGAHKCVAYEHIPYGVVLDENVSAERLGALPVVVLSDVGILSEREVSLLRAYVEEGGNLIVSGATGLYGHMGQPLPESSLSELIGARFKERLPDNDNFFALTSEDAAFAGDIPLDSPFLAYGPGVVYESTGAKTFGKLLRPVRTLRQQQGLEGTSFPSSAGEPAGPAVLVNAVGKGNVVTLAVSPGAASASEYRTVEARKFLRNAIRFANPNPKIEIRAPLHVESVVTEDPDTRTMRIHLIGYLIPPGTTSPGRPFVLPDLVEDEPLYDAEIIVHRPFQTTKPVDASSQVRTIGNRIEARIHAIHEVLVVNY